MEKQLEDAINNYLSHQNFDELGDEYDIIDQIDSASLARLLSNLIRENAMKFYPRAKFVHGEYVTSCNKCGNVFGFFMSNHQEFTDQELQKKEVIILN